MTWGGWCWCYNWVRWFPSKTPLFDMVSQHLDAWQHQRFLTRRWDIFQLLLWRRNQKSQNIISSSPRPSVLPKPKPSSTDAQCCHDMKLISNVKAKIYSLIFFFFFPWTPPRQRRVSSSRLESDISSWEASSVRIVFVEYFSSPADAVSWQHSVVWGTKQHHRNFCWISECLCTSFLYLSNTVTPNVSCQEKHKKYILTTLVEAIFSFMLWI